MSIGTLATVGVARDTKAVRRRDAGKAKATAPDEAAKTRDMVLAAIPVEVVGPYTFLVTVLIGLIDVEKGEHLDQFETARWALYALAVVGTCFFVWDTVRRKRARGGWKPVPALEVASAGVAAAVWGLTVPESPLAIRLNGDNRTIVPLFILIVGGIVYGVLSSGLAKGRRGKPS
jgi:hypothetical protein